MEDRSESPPAIGTGEYNTLPYTEKRIYVKHKGTLSTGLAHTAALLGFLLWVNALSPALRASPARSERVMADITPSCKKVCESQKKHKKNTSNI